MGPCRRILKVVFKSEEIALEAVDSEIYVLLGHRRVDHEALVRWGGRRVVSPRGGELEGSEREEREDSPDAVRGWIRHGYVFEPAGKDLIIVGGVAPTTDSRTRVIEEFCVVKVVCI